MAQLVMRYLDEALSKGFVGMLVSRLLLLVVGGLLGIFTPIFIYTILGNNLVGTLLYFGIASLVFFMLLPYGIRFVDSIGFRSALMISALVGAVQHYLFYVYDTNAFSIGGFLVATVLLLTLYRLTYWVPFHTEFALLSDHKQRGRQVSLFNALAMVLGVFLPALAAFLITDFGFDFVFLIAVGVMLLSALPYMYLPVLPQVYSWSIRQTWSEFRCRLKSRVAIGFVAEGVENLIALYLWPVFLYQLFDGDLLDVGTVSTLIIAGSVVLQLIVGNTIDKRHKADSALRVGSILYAVGWIVKMFVATVFQVFVVGVYHTISKILTETPAHTLFYDMASATGEYVDEFTVLREMYVNLGRFIGAVLAVLMTFFVSVQALFVIGALAALLFHFISDRDFALRRCM